MHEAQANQEPVGAEGADIRGTGPGPGRADTGRGENEIRNHLASDVLSMMRRSHVPGLSLTVVDRAGSRYSAGFGSADLQNGSPATPRTGYPWFSMTKLVTATAALRLADEGRLDFDGPVARHLDAVAAGASFEQLGAITTRQLLSHTAGLANPLPIRWIHPAANARPDSSAMTRALLGRRGMFAHPPGTTAAYSNVGYLVAGEVVSAVTGHSVEESLSELVLRPLRMAETSATTAPDNAAVGYLNAPWPLRPVMSVIVPRDIRGPRSAGVPSLRPFAVDGAAYGGLVGSVRDVGTFLRLHLGDGELDGTRILTPESARNMRTIVGHGRRFEHAIGWFRQPRPGRTDYVEHYGTGAGFWNVARIYPEAGIGVAIMTNGTRSFRFHDLMNGIADRFGRS
jgi:CubicO group peptidase (beta-lactamase class C family)